jgi:hypothetical protein
MTEDNFWLYPVGAKGTYTTRGPSQMATIRHVEVLAHCMDGESIHQKLETLGIDAKIPKNLYDVSQSVRYILKAQRPKSVLIMAPVKGAFEANFLPYTDSPDKNTPVPHNEDESGVGSVK